MPIEISSLNVSGLASALKAEGLLEQVLAAVTEPTRAALTDPSSAKWFSENVAVDLLSTILRLFGGEKLSDLNLRMTRDSIAKLALPLVKVALALGGNSPASLFSKLDTFAKLVRRGLSMPWQSTGPTSGTLEILYDGVLPAEVVRYAWQGVFRFGDELTGKTTRVDGFEVKGPRHFVFTLSW